MSSVKSFSSVHILELIYVIRDDDWAADFLDRFDFSLACCLHSIEAAGLTRQVVVTVVDLGSELPCTEKLLHAHSYGGFRLIRMTPAQLQLYCESTRFNVAIGNNLAIRRSRSKFCVLQASDCFYTPFQLKRLAQFFQSAESCDDTYYLVPRVFIPDQMPLRDLGPALSCATIDEWPAEQSVPAAKKFNLGGGYGSMAATVDLWEALGGLDEYPNFIGVDGDFFTRASIANRVVNLYDYGIKMYKFPRRQKEDDSARLSSKKNSLSFRHSWSRYSGNNPDWGAVGWDLDVKEFYPVSRNKESISHREPNVRELAFGETSRKEIISLTKYATLRFNWFIESLIDISTPNFFITDDLGTQLIVATLGRHGWMNGLVCHDQRQSAVLYNNRLSDTDSFILALRGCRSRIYKHDLSDLRLLWEKKGWSDMSLVARPMIMFPNRNLEEIQATLPISICRCDIIVAAGCSRSQFEINNKCFLKVVEFENFSNGRTVAIWTGANEPLITDLLNREAEIKWWIVDILSDKLIDRVTKLFRKIYKTIG